LKLKSNEQTSKLTLDGRIVQLEKQLRWLQGEFQNLMNLKQKNETTISDLKLQNKTLIDNTNELKNNVKAQQRQTKLLHVALTKAKHYQTDLVNLQATLGDQRSRIQKGSVEIPSLMYSPFLPIGDQQVSLHTVQGDGAQRLPFAQIETRNEKLKELNSDLVASFNQENSNE